MGEYRMGWEEQLASVLNKSLEKLSRVTHPKTKTLSDLVIEHYKHKNLVVEKNYAHLTKEDMLNEPNKFIEALEKV